MENGVTWCVRSTMRTSGMIEYITPRQSATESSTKPKSVMNTIVGGYFCAFSGTPFLASCARSGDLVPARNTRTTASATICVRFNEFQYPDFIGHDSKQDKSCLKARTITLPAAHVL